VSFFGPPPESDIDLAAEARGRGIENRVEIAGQVSYARCLREMAAADVLLLMDSPGRTVGVPAKLYEYIGAGRPVLALGSRDGDLAWVLRQSGVPHRIVAPDDRAGVAEALAQLVAEVRSGCDPGPPRDFHRFSREAIAGRLATLLDRCTAHTATAGVRQEGEAAPCPDDDSDQAATVEVCSTAAVTEGL
jgi:glycosyltransferase involved in cell wall biosynthesis